MSPRSVAELIELHEGRKVLAYQDSRGIWTVGVGHNLQSKPLPDHIITALRDDDIRDADQSCIAIFGAAPFAAFSPARQAVLVDMAFQLGQGGLSKFAHMIAAIKAGDWTVAAAEALASDWAVQTPARAEMNAEILRTGQWPK